MTFLKSWLAPLLCAGFLGFSVVAWAQAPAPAAGASQDANDPVSIGVAAFNRGHWATAMRAWRPAAEQGNAMAQTNMGYLFEHGLGVQQSYVQAMEWYLSLIHI